MMQKNKSKNLSLNSLKIKLADFSKHSYRCYHISSGMVYHGLQIKPVNLRHIGIVPH